MILHLEMPSQPVSSTLVSIPQLAARKRSGAFVDHELERKFCDLRFTTSNLTQFSLLLSAALLHVLMAVWAYSNETAIAAGRKVPVIGAMAALRAWLHRCSTPMRARIVMGSQPRNLHAHAHSTCSALGVYRAQIVQVRRSQ